MTMTLQIVDISKLGIVCAADSAITFSEEDGVKSQGTWPKLVRIDRLKAVVGYYGEGMINWQKLPDWLESFSRRSQANSIADYVFELKDRLNEQWIRPAGKRGTGFHVTGYTTMEQVVVPCFYHVWNHNGVEGGYKVIGDGFRSGSDFLGRDAAEYVPYRLNEYFANRISRVYRNGALSLYNELAEALYSFGKEVIRQNLIRTTQTITDWAGHYRFQMETLKLMYRYLTNIKLPAVGHSITIYTIDPEGTIKLLPNFRVKH